MRPISRKHSPSVFLGLLVALSGLSTAGAQEGTAGLPGAFLRMGMGARAAGMGRAFTAVADDPSALYWNPAGLVRQDVTELMGSYAFLSMDRRRQVGALVLPLKAWGTLGAGWTSLGIGDVEGRDAAGRVTGTFSSEETAYFVSWGVPMTPFLDVGVTGKIITHSLEEYRSEGFGWDAGLLFQPVPYLRIGAVLQDVSTRVSWDTQSGLEETYPTVQRVGAALQPPNFPLILSVDYERIGDLDNRVHAGVELSLLPSVGLRAGYDDGAIQFGASVDVATSLGHFRTDYSVGEDPIDRTYVHRLSFHVVFSGSRFSDYESESVRERPLEGYPALLSPPPDARIVRIPTDHPGFAVINSGSEAGVVEGTVYEVYRVEENGEGRVKWHIGTVEVLKVDEKFSAVRLIEEQWNRTLLKVAILKL